MRHWPRKISRWDDGATAPAATRSGRDPINPLRIQRLRKRGLSFGEIGRLIAHEDGRPMPYTHQGVYNALRRYLLGERDEDGERENFIPATNRKAPPISLGAGIGTILFPAAKRLITAGKSQ
jgi:hypothetical protein